MSLSDGVFLCYDRIGEWKPKEGEDINEGYIEVPKIKEFIQELKETIVEDINTQWVFDIIDKLAGDKLI